MLSWESYKWGLEADGNHDVPEDPKKFLERLKKEINEAKGEEAIQLLDGHIKAFEDALGKDPKSERVVLHGHDVARTDVEALLKDAERVKAEVEKGVKTAGEAKGFIKKTLDYIGEHKVATGVGGAVGLAAVGGGGYYLHRRREAARREREEAAREWFYR